MSLLEYNVLNKRIKESENAITEALQISDSVLREMILSETRRRLQQLYKKRTQLEDSLSREQISLRIYGDNVESGKVSTRILLATLDGFQNLTDSIANAILRTPTQKGKIPQSVLDLTNFQVTGVFAGSFGITLEKEETQLEAYSGMSQLTSVLGEFFTVLESTDHDELLLSSITPFGKRVVNHYREWLQELQANDVNLDIQWNDSLAASRRIHVLAEKAPKIISILDTIDSVDDREIKLTGKLTGINIRNLSFEMVVDGVGLIQGKSKMETLIALTASLGQEITATLIQSISTTKGNVQKVNWYLYEV